MAWTRGCRRAATRSRALAAYSRSGGRFVRYAKQTVHRRGWPCPRACGLQAHPERCDGARAIEGDREGGGVEELSVRKWQALRIGSQPRLRERWDQTPAPGLFVWDRGLT